MVREDPERVLEEEVDTRRRLLYYNKERRRKRTAGELKGRHRNVFVSVLCFGFFETGLFYVALAVMELAL